MKTTEAKAKEIRSYVEKLVTLAKKNTIAARKLAVSRLATTSDTPIAKLFSDYGPKYKDRAGGYTRITKLGVRKSDASPMAIIEFV